MTTTLARANEIRIRPEVEPTGLSDSQLKMVAPSIFASTPHASRGEHYGFIPTSEIVVALRDQGFFPVYAKQGKGRDLARREYAKHIVRFRHNSMLDRALNQDAFEISLTNSHDGTTAGIFDAGVYRLVCSNGLTVRSANFGSVKVYHRQSQGFFDQIAESVAFLLSNSSAVMSQVEHFKQLTLPVPIQHLFAEQARALVPSKPIASPLDLLGVRRYGDEGSDLWSVVNRVQENLMRGGLAGLTSNRRQVFTRPITSLDTDLSVNRDLWTMAEDVSEALS